MAKEQSKERPGEIVKESFLVNVELGRLVTRKNRIIKEKAALDRLPRERHLPVYQVVDAVSHREKAATPGKNSRPSGVLCAILFA